MESMLKERISDLEKEVAQLTEENGDLKRMNMRLQQGLNSIEANIRATDEWVEMFNEWRKK